MAHGKRAEREYVTATQLAAMATCEKRVLLAQRQGAETTSAQQASMRRGISLHARVAHSNDMGSPLGDLCRFSWALIRRALRAMTRLLHGRGASR